jgi:hypothetical protein
MMTRTSYFVRLGISVAIDVVDFTVGRLPVFGAVGEGTGAIALLFLWGWPGLLYLGELADPTEQLDGFIPTATLIAVMVGIREGHLFGKPKTDVSRSR